MASVGHIAVGMAASRIVSGDAIRERPFGGAMLFWSALSMLPDADVIVALTEDGLVSNVAAGENRGRRIVHAAVTRYIRHAERVKKGSATAEIAARIPIDRSWALANSRVLVLLQARETLKVIGAWSGAAPLEGETRLEGR